MTEDRTELLSDVLAIADEDNGFLEMLAVNVNAMLERKNAPRPSSPDYERLMDEAGRGLIPEVWETEQWRGGLVSETRILRAGGHSVLFHFKPYDGEIQVSADVHREIQRVGIPPAEGDHPLYPIADAAYCYIVAEIKSLERLKLQLYRVAAGQCAVQDED